MRNSPLLYTNQKGARYGFPKGNTLPPLGEKRLHLPLVGALRRFLGHLGRWLTRPVGRVLSFRWLLMKGGSSMGIDEAAKAGSGPGGRGGRTRTVAVALTPLEWEAWREAATLAGRPQLAAWVRDVVGAVLAGTELPDPGLVEYLDQITAELNRQGANLNQAVKALNTIAAAGGSRVRVQAAISQVEKVADANLQTLRHTWAAIGQVEE